MAGVRLEWAQFGDFDSFDVLRSDTSMDINALPSPLVTGLLSMFYVDTTVVEGATYYYRVVAWRDGASKVSGEIQVNARTSDEHWDKVVSLLHFNGNLTDANGHTFTSIGTTGFAAGKFGQALDLPAPDANVHGIKSDIGITDFALAGDFTVECWVNAAASQPLTESCIVGVYNPVGDNSWELSFDASTVFFYQQGAGFSNFVAIANVSLRGSGWKHIEINRSGAQVRLFIDGELKASGTSSVSYTSNNTPLHIGYQHGGGARYPFRGQIEELRITKGIARHTANFTPPDAPFPGH